MCALRVVVILSVILAIPNSYNVAALYYISIVLSLYEKMYGWVTQEQLCSGLNQLKNVLSLATICYSIGTCLIGLSLSILFAIEPQAMHSGALLINIMMLALLLHFSAVLVTASSTLYVHLLFCNVKVQRPPTVIGVVVPEGVVVTI